jgi:hypothetical protein
VELLAASLHLGRSDEPSSVTPALVAEVLDAALASDSSAEGRAQSLGYAIGLLLDYLATEDTELDSVALTSSCSFASRSSIVGDHEIGRVLITKSAEASGGAWGLVGS